MKHIVHTVEDCLETLTSNQTFEIAEFDQVILMSIAKQTQSGKALTDRQFAALQERLSNYEDQYIAAGIENVSEALIELRQPLRVIDRRKTIDVVKKTVGVFSENKKYIRIKSPFNKKTITKINNLAKEIRETTAAAYIHESGTKEHFFLLTERISHKVVDAFWDQGWEIDAELVSIRDQVAAIMNAKTSILPMIVDGEIVNASDKVLKQALAETSNSKVKLIDRHRRYGLHTEDRIDNRGIVSEIVNREEASVLISNETHSLDTLFSAIFELERTPLIVSIPVSSPELLVSCYNAINGVVKASEQSVLFRTANDATSITSVNEFIRDKKLNNWVDINTKIVYISSNKLPKLLVSTEWKPCAALMFSSTPDRFVDSYVNDCCDLTIYYEKMMSPLRKHSRTNRW